MTRILVIFATTDGHTRKVAQRIGETFRDQRIEVDVVEAGTCDVTPNDYAAVVVCASVHAGGYQRAVAHWVIGHVDALQRKPTAFVSVCLGILQEDPKVAEELGAIIGRFLTATGWQPAIIKKVAGALLYRQYGLVKRWMMKRIVARAGGDIDTSRDYEYTDWEDLRAFAKVFAGTITALRAHSRPPSETTAVAQRLKSPQCSCNPRRAVRNLPRKFTQMRAQPPAIMGNFPHHGGELSQSASRRYSKGNDPWRPLLSLLLMTRN